MKQLMVLILLLSTSIPLANAQQHTGYQSDMESEADSLNLKAKRTANKNLKKSYSLADSALKLSRRNNYSLGEASALNNLGNYYTYKGSYKKASENYLNCLKISRNQKFKTMEANALSNIGNVNFFMGNPDKAIEYNLKALEIYKMLEDNNRMANCYRNIGNTFFHKRIYDTSRFYYYTALDLYKKLKDTTGLAGTYHNLALIHHNTNDDKKAEKLYNKCLKLYSAKGNYKGTGLAKINLSNFYIKKDRLVQAEKHLKEAQKIISNSGMKEWKTDIYQLLSQLYKKKRDYNQALRYYKKYHLVYDSLRNEKRLKQINEIQTKYETKQIKKENQLKQVKIEKKQTIIKILTLASIVLLITIGALIFLAFKLKNNMQRVKNQSRIIKAQHNQIINEKQKVFDQQIKNKQRELTSNAIFLAQANKKNKKLIEELEKFVQNSDAINKKELLKLTKSHKISFSDNNLKEFEIQFNKLHSEFYSKLSEQFPQLSPKEKKLCALLRLNMTSKEIASITLTGENSINVARSRLRLKLGLKRDQNLINYLSTF
jgi:tetratricopeptide (TPR) repeat protein